MQMPKLRQGLVGQAAADAYKHAEEEKVGYSVSRQKVIVKLLKIGLKEEL